MSRISNIVSFGASITTGAGVGGKSNAWSAIIAKKLEKQYICLAKAGSSNTTIARDIISSDIPHDSFVLVLWASTTRYEFWNKDHWEQISAWDKQTGFIKEWYRGPGQWIQTEIVTTLKEIYLAQSYLRSLNIPYLFTLDSNEIHKNWLVENNDVEYVTRLKNIIDWSKIMLFEGQGFIPWAQQNNFGVSDDGHPDITAHQAAADYILANSYLQNLT